MIKPTYKGPPKGAQARLYIPIFGKGQKRGRARRKQGMGLARVEFGVVGRTRGTGRAGSAVASAAYNLCGQLDAYDFRRKASEHVGGAVLLPPGAPPELADPAALWRAAEACERRSDAQLCRQLLVTIPREIAAADRLDFVAAIVAPYVADGMGCQLDVHCPKASDGEEQPHAHVLLTLRRVTGSGLAKAKERAWNDQFREEGGRAERSRISARATAWLEVHGNGNTYDLRSLAARGDDRPPEPTAPRADWQRWLREGADASRAPITVAATLRHRGRVAALAVADGAEKEAAAEVADLARQLAAAGSRHAHEKARPPQPRTAPSRNAGISQHLAKAPPQKESDMPKVTPRRRVPVRRRPQDEPWIRHGEGMDALSAPLRASAERSYARWTEGNPQLAERHDLRDYVDYVQRHQRRRMEDEETTDAEAATKPTTPGIAPESEARAEAGRRRHLDQVLSDRYQVPEAVAPYVHRVRADARAGTATLDLKSGGQLTDYGDRVTHEGPLTKEAAEAMVALAAAKGWGRVNISGSNANRDAVAMACAVRVPPLPCSHDLSKKARAEVATRLQEKATAAVPTLDRQKVAALAETDPAAAARRVLDHAEARARAQLAGRPAGSTDPSAISWPRLAELAEGRQVAREDADEARAAANAHRGEHPWASRLLDGAARRRQSALDADARRLTGTADQLDRSQQSEGKRITQEATRQARATAQAVEDWRWLPETRRAEAQLAQVAAVRHAVTAGNEATIAAAARGDLRAASAAALASTARPRTTGEPSDPKAAAILALHQAEQGCTDPTTLARARTATAAAVAGDTATIAAAAGGNVAAAQTAGHTWQRRQDEERRRQAALTAARAAIVESGEDYAPT